MATDLIRLPISIPASASLTTKQYYFMKVDTNGQLATNTTSGGFCDGVLQDKPTAQGEPGQICGPGDITKVIAASSVTKGDRVMSDGSGKAVTATSGAQILGRALDTFGSGEYGRVRFLPYGKL